MRSWLAIPLLGAALASCRDAPAVPTSVYLTIEVAAGAARPDELLITGFGDGALLFSDRRLPTMGSPIPETTSGPVGTVTVYVPSEVAEARVEVGGYLGQVLRARGTTTVRIVRDRQVSARVVLEAASVDAGDGDGGGTIDAADGGTGGTAGNGGTGDSGTDVADRGAPDLNAFDVPPDGACQGSLFTALADMPPNLIDLTAEGTLDWRFWGTSGMVNFKRSAGNLISDYTLIGTGAIATRFRNAVAFSWSDGVPTTSQLSTNETMAVSAVVGEGVSLTVPADSTTRTVSVYVGGTNDTGLFEASLSDGCAAPYSATATNGRGAYTNAYRLTFRSAVPGTMLRIRWTMSAGFEAIGLYAVTLQ